MLNEWAAIFNECVTVRLRPNTFVALPQENHVVSQVLGKVMDRLTFMSGERLNFFKINHLVYFVDEFPLSELQRHCFGKFHQSHKASSQILALKRTNFAAQRF
jgi:hypothetical protein